MDHGSGVMAALFQRFLGSLGSGLLTPAEGVAPAAAGTQKPPIAGIPDSSAQGEGLIP